MTEKKLTPQQKYDSFHTKRYNIKLNLETDADIIARLKSVESMQGYIKRLIREDIAKAGQ